MNNSVKVFGPSSLITALPFLLGFKPEQSLICVLLEDDAITGCIRYELSNDEDQMFELISHTLKNHRYQAMVVVITTDDLTHDLGSVLKRFEDAQIQLLDFLITNWHRYRSAMCQDVSCCPLSGTELTLAQQDQIAAQLVASGHVAASSREELLARLDSNPISIEELPNEADIKSLSAAELIDQVTNIVRQPFSALWVMQLANALIDPEIRNDLEYHIFSSTKGELNDVEQLRITTENLRQVAVRAPAHKSAMAYGLLAFCYWNLGEWILAQASSDIALLLDSSNSPAKLTKRLLNQGVDPVQARSQIFPAAA